MRTLPLGLAVAAFAAAAATAAPAHAAADPLVQLTANVLPNIAAVTGTPAPAAKVLSIGLALARPDVAGENAELAAMYDPASPAYHHFLTPASFAAKYGVPRTRVDAATALLTSAGLTVASVSTDGSYISASGTVAQVEQAFHVTENSFVVKGVSFVANLAGPLVPAALGVTSVVGLNTAQHFITDSAPMAPVQDTCTGGICTGATTPADLWSLYDQPAAYEGKGQRIAIIGEGDPTEVLADLKADEKAYGLPTVPVTVNCVQDNDCGTDTSGNGEWQIDTQASLGMAPQADGEELYFARTIYDGDLNNSFIAWAQDPNGPTVASASLGECEASPLNGALTSGPLAAVNGNLGGGIVPVDGLTAPLALGDGEETTIDPILKEAVMLGKTLFASTGDTGSSCPAVYLGPLGGGNGILNQGVPEQNYPAVSAYAVAVGGTVAYTADNGEGAGSTYKTGQPAATRASETAWTNGGGGASLYIPAPSWQAKVSAISQPCVIGVDGSTAVTGVQCRGVPDVAAQSGDVLTNGYSLATANSDGTTSFTQGGGTSLSSPLTAGMWTRVLAAAGKNLGFAAPLLYQSGTNATTYARDFHDITNGLNGLHTAAAGWDYTTGFGTMQVDGLICDLAGKPSGRYAAGVAGACPLVAASTGTSKVAKKKTTTKKKAAKTTTAKASQPGGTLAYTGLDAALPVGAVLLLAGAGVAARRRSRRGE